MYRTIANFKLSIFVSCKRGYYWTSRIEKDLFKLRFAHISSHLHRCKYRLIVKNSIQHMPFALKRLVMEMVKESVVGCLFVQFYDFVKGLFCLLVFTCLEIQHSENILIIQIIHVSPLAIHKVDCVVANVQDTLDTHTS